MRTMRILLLCLGLAATMAAAETPRGYFRYPAIHGDTVVFTAEGDLWRVSSKGGTAQRLTTHPGSEVRAAISRDGKTLAYNAEYEGPTEVYTMPLDGGLPVRQTYAGGDTQVVGWTPDGHVLFSTDAFSMLPNRQLVSLDTATNTSQLLPLAQASQGAIDPESGTLFFTRLPRQNSSTKRYKGGWVENLWSYREGGEAKPVTQDFSGTTRNAMWWQGRVYCVSDRDGVMNLWSLKPDGSDAKQLTHYKDFDVKSASLDQGRIAYQQGADLWVHDIAQATDTKLDIRLTSDFDQMREKWVKKPMEYLTSSAVSPNGDRVALTARGQAFVAPVEQGRFVELPRKEGVRYRNARFMPDGKNVLVQSDESGEIEFWTIPANGVGDPKPLTHGGTVFRSAGVSSPDGKWIAWGDKNQRLWVKAVDGGDPKLIAESQEEEIDEFAWSPDSQWLAYVEQAANTFHQVKLCRIADNAHTSVTSDRVESFSPAWSPDGKWLYFLSNRQIRTLVESPWGQWQPDPFFTETTKLYQVALTKGLRSPFQAHDELNPAPTKPKIKVDEKKEEVVPEKTEGKEEPKAEEPPAKPAPSAVTIDLDGLATRLHELPVPAGNYRKLTVSATHLFWLAKSLGFDAKSQLKVMSISAKSPKPATLVEDLAGYELSADRKKLLIHKGENFHVIATDTAAPAKLDDNKVKLDGWAFSIDPREEWRQVYAESWRMLRDFFYDTGMHGVDWKMVREKYRPLVERVSDRSELSDVIFEMAGELSTLHIFVRYGDERKGDDHIDPASLGAELVKDATAGGWRVQHIYRADPDFPSKLSPLSQPGVDVTEGDVLLRINGHGTLGVPHPESLLRNQAGKQVLLEVKPRNADKPRSVIVKPISATAETSLRYDEWELTRREQTDRLGKGRIGYVHLRAMGEDNMAEWARDFYPVFQREGLIIDVRNNRGGNIDSWILGKLLRKAWNYFAPRIGSPATNMQYAYRGHIVVLCNEKTASDGEAFSEGFKRLGLGKVIGTRTWGGEIWLNARRWLVDSGMATAAETGVYGPEGSWLIEGHGVDPDIVVDNLPHETFTGRDAQLEAAVKHLEELIAKEPRPMPPIPARPIKRGP